MQKFKIIPTNFFRLTGIQFFNFFFNTKMFFEMQLKYITNWGNFHNFLSENEVNFVLQ